MDTPLLTIGEASQKTGRSHSTIRRLIHSIVEKDSHADRSAVVPTPAQVVTLKKKGDNFSWKIREDVLLREFGSAPKAEKKLISDRDTEVLGMLKTELELKNQQISKQWEVIQALNERLREGNILMGSLQKRLALPEPQSPAESVVDTPAMASTAEVSKGPSKKHSKASAAPSKAKGGLFRWLRG